MSEPRPGDRLALLVAEALVGLRRPALVLHEPGLSVVVPDAAGDDGPVAVQPWDEPVPVDPPRTVVLVAADAGTARQAVSVLAGVRWSRCFGIVLRDATRVVPVPHQPLWPAVTSATAQLLEGGAVTTVELAARAPGSEVLTALVLGSVPGPTGHGGLRVASPDPAWAPPADPTVVRHPEPAATRPPDVLLAPTAGGGLDSLGAGAPPGSTTGGPMVEPGERSEPESRPGEVGSALADGGLDPLGAGAPLGSTVGGFEVNAVTGRPTVLVDPGLGALDPGVWSPAAFDATSDGTTARLAPDARLGVALVAALARREAVDLAWPASGPEDRTWLRTVAGLALCGVPLVAVEPTPTWARTILGDVLADVLHETSGEPRDVRRARLRRAALLTHATPAWRRRVGAAAGVRVAVVPRVELVGPGEHPAAGADLVLRHGGSSPSEAAVELLVAVREATGADVVGVTDGPTEAWGRLDEAGPFLGAPTAGATTYAVPRIALDRR